LTVRSIVTPTARISRNCPWTRSPHCHASWHASTPELPRAIGSLPLSAQQVRGRAVLVHTGWDQHWRTDQYLEGHPYLTGALAQWLLDAGALLVGIDSHNIDCTDGGERPVHSVLLRYDIPMVEHLCGLAAVPEHGARFFAMPVKVKGFGTFPVRAFAMLDR
jgi:kynurenine formamidase